MTITRRQAIDLLDRHGVRPSRALGQNFVVDPNTVRRIVRLAGVAPDDPVVEVGAGIGSLTVALAEAGADVTAVELDRHLLPVLGEVLDVLDPPPRVVHGDALRLDWHDLLAGHERWQLVANLPYNVATPLVLDMLDGVAAIDRMLVMVQREVGERLAAAPGRARTASRRSRLRTGRLLRSSDGSARPSSCRGRRSSRCSYGSLVARGRPRRPIPTGCSRWCVPASDSVARCCAAHWLDWSTPAASSERASRRRAGRSS